MKHVPRVSPHSAASIDPGSVEIGLVQLSQSLKTTNVAHICLKTKNGLTSSREVNEARGAHTCSRPYAFEKMEKKKNETIRPTQNTARNPQQPGHRDHLETARDETRPTLGLASLKIVRNLESWLHGDFVLAPKADPPT